MSGKKKSLKNEIKSKEFSSKLIDELIKEGAIIREGEHDHDECWFPESPQPNNSLMSGKKKKKSRKQEIESEEFSELMSGKKKSPKKEIKSEEFSSELIDKLIKEGVIIREGEDDDDEWIWCHNCYDFVSIEKKCKHKQACGCSNTVCPSCNSVVRSLSAWSILEEEGYL